MMVVVHRSSDDEFTCGFCGDLLENAGGRHTIADCAHHLRTQLEKAEARDEEARDELAMCLHDLDAAEQRLMQCEREPSPLGDPWWLRAWRWLLSLLGI